MPTSLWIALLTVSILFTPLAVMLNLRLSRGDNRSRGLILPTALAVLVYGSFVTLLSLYGAVACLALILINLPLLASILTYFVVRMKRYSLLFAEYKRQVKERRPPVATTARLNAALEGFSCATTLTDEALREVIILMKSGTSHEKIAAIYDCPITELKHIEKFFDRHRAEKNGSKNNGSPYTISEEQGEFFLQLMVNATPKSLGCGDYLVWNADSVAELVRNATQIKPDRKSVANFLSSTGLVPREDDMAITKTPEALQWSETEYRKIRLSALERGAEIVWIFSPKPESSRKYIVVSAVKSDGSSSFGVYKGTGAFADFLTKLSQQAHAPLYAVICTEYQRFKNLNSLPSDIFLFPLGKNASIPDLSHR